ncbi:myeloid differentiation primary response protein MyD88 [Petromyzon marinus]|uniref:Myeloid differentiation primary response protein MyD88 n=2 Tax=Petromyzon marinus TaxID=7757 RepID=A0AAJ7UAF7_PETMA|nr:myeloid differentiation primary response protein MyD88 [Petromyzon marinus]XP_032831212.1 myeloid differentiation primary response protein MyD88 [Petromyzon marinus]XP_032831213.1 myeloid differentiation primary response protein MyD88 [Petromyzon marinus]
MACTKPRTSAVNFHEVPLRALNTTVRKQLALFLNPVLLGSANWERLAEELGFDYLHIRNMDRCPDPTWKLLDECTSRNNSTVGALLDALLKLERHDVITDLQAAIEQDCVRFLAEKKSGHPPPRSEPGPFEPPDCVTMRDVPEVYVEKFDAFVCYCYADIDFVKEMIQNLERSSYSLKLCVMDRDVLPGQCVYTISSELIENRCNKIVVIISDDFLESSECDFQTKLALSIAPGARSRRLIPVKYKAISKTYPGILRHITMSDYTKLSTKEWFWDRLAKAIKY